MCIEAEQRDQFLVARFLPKRLDAALAPKFKSKMQELIDYKPRYLLLDLTNAEFIDSSGLGAIVASLKQLGGHGDLVLCGAHDAVASLLRLTRMDKVFQMYDTVEDAIAANH